MLLVPFLMVGALTVAAEANDWEGKDRGGHHEQGIHQVHGGHANHGVTKIEGKGTADMVASADKLRRELPGIGATEEQGLDALARVKYFAPDGGWTWWASEWDGEDISYALVAGVAWNSGRSGFRSSRAYAENWDCRSNATSISNRALCGGFTTNKAGTISTA